MNQYLYCSYFVEARVWLNKSEAAKKMEEEHTQTIQLIQSESKAKIISLENSLDELKEKLQLGQKNTAVLSEILAENDKKMNTFQSESVAMQNENSKLQNQLKGLLEGFFF